MRKSVTTTKQTPSAQHASSEPPQQPREPGASHPADWLQLSFELNVMTWQQEMKQRWKREQENP